MAHANATESIVVYGCNDEVTTCDHCGRTGLKATVALAVDGGPIVRFGRSCAATALKVGEASIRRAIRTVEKLERSAAAQARSAAARAESDAWFAWLAEQGWREGEGWDRFGGFTAARAAYRAATGKGA